MALRAAVLILGLGLGLAKSPACAAAAAPAPDQSELYLEVLVDGQDSGQVAPFTRGAHGLRSKVETLRDLGLDAARFGVAGQDSFDLDSVPGLAYRFDPARQSIDLRLGDTLRAPLVLAARPGLASAPGQVTPGFLLNYDLYGQLGSSGSVAVMHEARYFDAYGVFSSTGNLVARGADGGYVRYDTSWTHSDPGSLASVTLGDVVTPSLSWSRSLRMGGIEWRKNFSLRPDLLTYPVANLSGTAVVPSSVSLYVNGIQQMSAAVPSGPFVLNQVAGLNGAGQATIVTRDALGRTVSNSMPLYVDTRLLAPGLVDYALDLGALRRGYGRSSFDYASSPAATGSLRYGLSERLTVETHAEAGSGLANGGAGLLWRLGQLGVLNGALAASRAGQGAGCQAAFGYQYVSPGFSVDAQTMRASRRYADLGSAEGTPVSRVNDRLSLSMALGHAQSAGLSWVASQDGVLPTRARIASALWSSSFGHGVFLSLSGYRDLDNRKLRGVAFSLSAALGERVGASANLAQQGGETTRSVALSRAPDYAGGLGWSLQKGSVGEREFDQAQARYLGSAGEISVLTQGNGISRSTAAGLNGSLVLMDGSLNASRQVGGGFALVATGVPDLPVLHENRLIGRTDASGHLLVPDLIPYMPNQISIDTSGLPADVRIASAAASIVPQRQAGVLAGFGIERFTAATVLVRGADGKPVPDGSPVRNADSGATTIVGYDGVVFVDGLKEHNRLLIGSGAGACEVRFDYHPGADDKLPVLGPLTCAAPASTPKGTPP